MRKRGFEVVSGWEDKSINIPIRKTKYSAGYDIEAAEDVTISPYTPGAKPTLIPTGLKAYCESDEYIMLVNRSSGPKKGIVLANSVGIIDVDYYGNISNDGHIFFQFWNHTNEDITIKKGDAIGQAIFQKYLLVDDDVSTGERVGAFGSTDK